MNTVKGLQEDAHCMLLLMGTASMSNFVTIHPYQPGCNGICDACLRQSACPGIARESGLYLEVL